MLASALPPARCIAPIFPRYVGNAAPESFRHSPQAMQPRLASASPLGPVCSCQSIACCSHQDVMVAHTAAGGQFGTPAWQCRVPVPAPSDAVLTRVAAVHDQPVSKCWGRAEHGKLGRTRQTAAENRVKRGKRAPDVQCAGGQQTQTGSRLGKGGTIRASRLRKNWGEVRVQKGTKLGCWVAGTGW